MKTLLILLFTILSLTTYGQVIDEKKISQRAELRNITNLEILKKRSVIKFTADNELNVCNFILDCYHQNTDLKFEVFINGKRYRLVENDLKKWIMQRTKS